MNDDVDFVTNNKCRICNSDNLLSYLDLGITPLANGLISKSELTSKELTFPLSVSFCSDCCLSQLTVTVNPKKLFSNYLYMSSISKTFQNHCKIVSTKTISNLSLGKSDLVVDIASNDGCLLKEFKKNEINVLGIEPASNLAKIANAAGIETLNEFWNEKTAKYIKEKLGGADLITGLNVFAHVDDVHSFIKNVKIALNENGILVLEVPYLVDFLGKHEFDTVYHEHLSYFLLKPLELLLKMNDMKIIDARKYEIHGGTIEIHAVKNDSKIEYAENHYNDFLLIEKNLGLHSFDSYINFSNEVKNMKKNFIELISELKENNYSIAGFAASAKGNTLLNFCELNHSQIDYIVDETPTKQNLYTPGSKIPIVEMNYFEKNYPDFLIILAWNFTDEIISKTKNFKKNGGKYIIPIPKIQII